MKIQILKSIDSGETIENYNHVIVTSFSHELNFPNNSMDEIIITHSLGVIPREKMRDFAISLCNKLRIGGKIFIQDYDITSVCKGYLSESIDSDTVSEIFKENNLYSLEEMLNLFNELGLVAESYQIIGLDFTITLKNK